MTYYVSKEKADALLARLKEEYLVFAPKVFAGRGWKKGTDLVRYGQIDSFEEAVWDRMSDYSPKEVYFPMIREMFRFEKGAMSESAAEIKPMMIFMRPCDINGMERLDRIFLDNGGRQDSFYRKMRRRVRIAMIRCEESFPECFCVSMGANTTGNYDLAMRVTVEGFYFDDQTEENADLFDNVADSVTLSDLQPRQPFVNENRLHVPEISIGDHKVLEEVFRLPLWEEFEDSCRGCGSCTTVCPTCSCFNTVDVFNTDPFRDDEDPEGERRRVWASCMADGFTMMAAGHGVREKNSQNLRFRVLHKMYDYRERFGEKNMCVGCGRCIRRCPEDISIQELACRLAEHVNGIKNDTPENSLPDDGGLDRKRNLRTGAGSPDAFSGNPMLPQPHKVLRVTKETAAEYTFRVAAEPPEGYGCFYMLSIPLFGEAPISVSGKGLDWVEFTIRKVGKLTGGVFGLRENDTLFMRGPYGNTFPISKFAGKDLVVITGGTGLAPVRSLLRHYCDHPGEVRSVHLIAGFKEPDAVLFRDDLDEFDQKFHLIKTLDNMEADGFRKGMVTEHIGDIPFASFEDYNVIIVGPPVMMRFAAKACLACGASEEKIWLSFERKMSCAIGKCGHCKINETYVCLEGPVFRYPESGNLLD